MLIQTLYLEIFMRNQSLRGANPSTISAVQTGIRALAFSETQTALIHRENFFDYLEAISAQLSEMASLNGNGYLAHLLHMASDEARVSKIKVKLGWAEPLT
jgi:hypothetical protein